MRILLTNDDGTNSEGLWALAEALNSVGEVYVVAPDRDRSGISAAMTLLDVVRANPINSPVCGVDAYAVQGTPADCVILAHQALYDEPFDIIFSGINQGRTWGPTFFCREPWALRFTATYAAFLRSRCRPTTIPTEPFVMRQRVSELRR